MTDTPSEPRSVRRRLGAADVYTASTRVRVMSGRMLTGRRWLRAAG